jgi:mono/diheme cytochrome c family protein
MPASISFLSSTLACLFFFMALVHAGGSDENYEYGEELYDLSCSICHGKNMINPGTSSFNLKEFPLDKKERFIESVNMGKGFMPSFGEIFDPEEIEQLWIYVSTNNES